VRILIRIIARALRCFRTKTSLFSAAQQLKNSRHIRKKLVFGSAGRFLKTALPIRQII